MPISILLITRDRSELLARVLADLRVQDYQGEFEIVVVEETDNPEAPEGVVYVPHPMKNLGIAYARNLSVQHASHDILVFIDDDCRVEESWLTRLVAPLVDSDVLGVQGGVTVPQDTNAIGWAESLLGFPGGGITRIHQAQGQAQATIEVSTLNACYRKDAVLNAGCFAGFARFGGEDYVLAKKIAEQGRLMFVPDAVVKHEARGKFSAIWTWFVRRGRAEFDLWHSGEAPQGYGLWMLRASQSLKLLPFVLLGFWSVYPLLFVVFILVMMNMWRFRWVLKQPDIPQSSWWCLPWVRLSMGLATDVGRLRAWVSQF